MTFKKMLLTFSLIISSISFCACSDMNESYRPIPKDTNSQISKQTAQQSPTSAKATIPASSAKTQANNCQNTASFSKAVTKEDTEKQLETTTDELSNTVNSLTQIDDNGLSSILN